MKNPFRKIGEDVPLNVVQEVGRDPLRPDMYWPMEEKIAFARKAAIARRTLAQVLPQPIKVT